MSRVIRLTPWRILTRHARPYVEPEKWSTLGVRPAGLVLTVVVALLVGLLVGTTVRAGLDRPGGVATGSVTGNAVVSSAPTAVAHSRSARWPMEPVERPSPPTPSAAAVGARSTSFPARPGHSVRGKAKWYCNSDPTRAKLSRCRSGYPDRAGILDLYAAAGPALRVGDWRGRVVTLNGWLRVRLIDSCGSCSWATVIDLYADSFAQLAPLGRGVVEVSIRW